MPVIRTLSDSIGWQRHQTDGRRVSRAVCQAPSQAHLSWDLCHANPSLSVVHTAQLHCFSGWSALKDSPEYAVPSKTEPVRRPPILTSHISRDPGWPPILYPIGPFNLQLQLRLGFRFPPRLFTPSAVSLPCPLVDPPSIPPCAQPARPSNQFPSLSSLPPIVPPATLILNPELVRANHCDRKTSDCRARRRLDDIITSTNPDLGSK
ncbi:Nitrogen assimilation transcription factor nit-4 [Fusarium oxysporum f. sp. albedinis]|nr:Nitrogen assimilation transcription factor nit-4 [Fusarium oxysporum f. sp. albedinis]